MASIRKAINQFLKLGFINNKMESYHKKTKQFQVLDKAYGDVSAVQCGFCIPGMI